MGCLARAARIWQAAQVEFHGQYSESRLAELTPYYYGVSRSRVLAVAAVTPLPCLVMVIVLDLAPLRSPEAGNVANWVFWARYFCLCCITTLSVTVLFHRALRFPAAAMHAVPLVVVFTGVCSSIVSIGMAEAICFPLPFLSLLAVAPWNLFFYPSMAMLWGKHFRSDPNARANGLEYLKITLLQTIMISFCPVYLHVFRQLAPIPQGLFSLLLPAVKVVVKNISSSVFSRHADLRPEDIVLSTELFASLFTTFTMQASSSLLPVILLTGSDVLQACVTLYDLNHIATGLATTGAQISALRDDPNPTLAPVEIGNTLRHGETAPRGLLQDTLEMLQMEDKPAISGIATRDPRSSTSPRWRSPVARLKAIATRVLPIPTSRVWFSMRGLAESRAKIAPLDIARAPTRVHLSHVKLPPPDESRSTNVQRRITQQESLHAQQTLRFLHATEYVVLVEFVEVIIPAIYGKYYH